MSVIFLDADHRGATLKTSLKNHLEAQHNKVNFYNSENKSDDDFNDPALRVAKDVLSHPGSFGILLCGTAAGVSIQANRFKGIRAVVCFNKEIAKLAREHNDANIICIPADFVTPIEASEMIDIFLKTDFTEHERYVRRNKRLDEEKI